MGSQRLGERKVRKIATATGLPVLRAWAHGGYVYDFVTAGHLHGWYSLKDGEWGIQTGDNVGDVMHYTSCPPPHGGHWPEDDPMFLDGVPALTEAEQEALGAAITNAP
jgi:hypothetical protein